MGIVLTENRLIRSCNATFAAMVGYVPADLIGQSFRMFYGSHEEFLGIRDIGLARLHGGTDYTDERLVRHRDGQSLWCRFRARTLTPTAPLDRVVMSFARMADTAPALTLTKRERQVLGLMNQGLFSKEIAGSLGLSVRTVDDVRGRLIRRFGVKRAADILGRMTDTRV